MTDHRDMMIVAIGWLKQSLEMSNSDLRESIRHLIDELENVPTSKLDSAELYRETTWWHAEPDDAVLIEYRNKAARDRAVRVAKKLHLLYETKSTRLLRVWT